MGSKERRVIITFPRYTLETSNFRDPRERPPERRQDDQYRDLCINGFHPQPDPVFAPAELLPLPNKDNVSSGMDEDHLRRVYAAAAFLMQKPTERRALHVIRWLQ
jgi:hypothetical protein